LAKINKYQGIRQNREETESSSIDTDMSTTNTDSHNSSSIDTDMSTTNTDSHNRSHNTICDNEEEKVIL
jgi:hypothetical protein